MSDGNLDDVRHEVGSRAPYSCVDVPVRANAVEGGSLSECKFCAFWGWPQFVLQFEKAILLVVLGNLVRIYQFEDGNNIIRFVES